jgi:hypothetical protein
MSVLRACTQVPIIIPTRPNETVSRRPHKSEQHGCTLDHTTFSCSHSAGGDTNQQTADTPKQWWVSTRGLAWHERNLEMGCLKSTPHVNTFARCLLRATWNAEGYCCTEQPSGTMEIGSNGPASLGAPRQSTTGRTPPRTCTVHKRPHSGPQLTKRKKTVNLELWQLPEPCRKTTDDVLGRRLLIYNQQQRVASGRQALIALSSR